MGVFYSFIKGQFGVMKAVLSHSLSGLINQIFSPLKTKLKSHLMQLGESDSNLEGALNVVVTACRLLQSRGGEGR